MVAFRFDMRDLNVVVAGRFTTAFFRLVSAVVIALLLALITVHVFFRPLDVLFFQSLRIMGDA